MTMAMMMGNFALIKDGQVINTVVWDGDEIDFGEGVTSVELPADTQVEVGYSYTDGAFVAPAAPVMTQVELVSEAEKQKTQTLQSINDISQMWQTQLALGIITDDDKATLTLWMKYAQEVDAVDTSTAPDIVWPTEPAS